MFGISLLNGRNFMWWNCLYWVCLLSISPSQFLTCCWRSLMKNAIFLSAYTFIMFCMCPHTWWNGYDGWDLFLILPLLLKLIMNPHKFSGSVNSLNIALFTEGAELSRDISPCSSKKKIHYSLLLVFNNQELTVL